MRGLSKPLLTVPCGHCAECSKRTQDDWFVRAIFETKRVERVGGAVWVPILTYRNEDLPTWSDDEYAQHIGIPSYRIPCFDPDHIRIFRSRLRVALSRNCYLSNGQFVTRRRTTKPKVGDTLLWEGRTDIKDDNTIRYISCCEYGDERGRSHMHMLLFVPFRVPAKVMRYIIDYAWSYGMVRYSRLGMMAKGMRAARYSMKYVSKDMCWSTKYNTDDYEQWLKHMKYTMKKEKCGIDAEQKYSDRLKAFRRAKPRHFQSMGFGIDGVDYFKNPDGSWNKERCVSMKLDGSRLGCPPIKSGSKKGMAFQYHMPMYYVRKIFYNVDDWNLYRLTEFGQEIFALRYGLHIRTHADFLSRALNPTDIATFYSTIEGDSRLGGRKLRDIGLYLGSLMENRTPQQLAVFDTVYRNIEGTDYNEPIIRHLNEGMSDAQQLRWLDDNALDFMMAQKTIDITPSPRGVINKSNFKVADTTFNDLPCFRNFVEILTTIEQLNEILGEQQQRAAEIERERQRKLGLYEENYISSNFIFTDYE